MTRPTQNAASGFNNDVIEAFRANHGRVTGSLSGTPILLLHHLGARSGIERVTPLTYTREEADGYLIVASNGGSPTHPSWYYNLKANPKTRVETETETFTARAEELKDGARAEVWGRLLAESPSLRQFDATTSRPIPVLRLARSSSSTAALPALAAAAPEAAVCREDQDTANASRQNGERGD